MGAPDAGAQNLLDILFGGGNRFHRQPRGEYPPPPQQRRAPVQAAKISAPSYYTYKADQMVPVDFTRLISATQSASLEPRLPGTDFREAIGGLAEFDLSAEKEVAKALVEYYSANPDFIWVSEHAANSRAEEAIRTLNDAASHGLDPADYAVAVPPAGSAAGRWRR